MFWEVIGTRAGKPVRARINAESQQAAARKAQADGVEVGTIRPTPAVPTMPAPPLQSFAPRSGRSVSVAPPLSGPPGPPPTGITPVPLEPHSSAGWIPYAGMSSIAIGALAIVLALLGRSATIVVDSIVPGLFAGIIGWVNGRKHRQPYMHAVCGTIVCCCALVLVFALALNRRPQTASNTSDSSGQSQSSDSAAVAPPTDPPAPRPDPGRSPVATSTPPARSTPAPQPAPLSPPISISAEDLMKAFIANEAAGIASYRGHILEVTGTITEIRRTSVVFNVGDKKNVQCTMSRENEPSLIPLRVGQKITCRGKCTGGSSRNISIRDGKIIG